MIVHSASIILNHVAMPELQEYHCIRCTSMMFKTNRDLLTIWIGGSYPSREIPLDMGWQEYKCRGCGFLYNVYWQ